MRTSILRALVLVGLLLTTLTAAAATRYISDQLSTNMRRGPGTNYRIMQLIDSGTRVETLSESKGWTKVRTSDGDTGYVLTRFLSDTPSARNRLDAMDSKMADLKQENSDLKSELAKALKGSSKLGETKRKLIADKKSLSDQLKHIKEASANAVRISQENQDFREKILSMKSEVERLRHENKSLQSRREGMKIGALILIGGIILGLILPMFRRRSRSSWDSL